jgi:hypothetical protein
MWASQMVPDQTDTFGNFGAFMSRNFGSMLFVLILDRLVLCYTIKFQEATFVNLYGIQVVHILVACRNESLYTSQNLCSRDR